MCLDLVLHPAGVLDILRKSCAIAIAPPRGASNILQRQFYRYVPPTAAGVALCF
jgi:hypothetical protein